MAPKVAREAVGEVAVSGARRRARPWSRAGAARCRSTARGLGVPKPSPWYQFSPAPVIAWPIAARPPAASWWRLMNTAPRAPSGVTRPGVRRASTPAARRRATTRAGEARGEADLAAERARAGAGLGGVARLARALVAGLHPDDRRAAGGVAWARRPRQAGAPAASPRSASTAAGAEVLDLGLRGLGRRAPRRCAGSARWPRSPRRRSRRWPPRGRACGCRSPTASGRVDVRAGAREEAAQRRRPPAPRRR